MINSLSCHHPSHAWSRLHALAEHVENNSFAQREAGWVSSVKGTFQRETPLTPYNLYTFDGKNKFCLRFSLKQTNAMKTQLPTSIVRKLGDTPNLMELITFFHIAITWGILHFPKYHHRYQDLYMFILFFSNPGSSCKKTSLGCTMVIHIWNQ